MFKSPEIVMRKVAEVAGRTVNKVTYPFRETFFSPLILAKEISELQSPKIAKLTAGSEGVIMGLFVNQAILIGGSPAETVVRTALGWGCLSILCLAHRNTNLIYRKGRERIQRIHSLEKEILYLQAMINRN